MIGDVPVAWCCQAHVHEPLAHLASLTKLDPQDVMTTAEARSQLNPLIRPLPSFDEMALGSRALRAA